MKASELNQAKNLDLMASDVALKRAAYFFARKTAIPTNTAIVAVKNGVLCRISAKELKQQEHA